MSAVLLQACDDALGGGKRSWTDLVVVRNVGPIRSREVLSGDNIAGRGFNGILHSPDGSRHFIKVRAESQDRFGREVEASLRLSAHAQTRGLVPDARSFVVDGARVLALAFVPGLSLEQAIARRNLSWVAAADRAIELRRKFAAPLADLAAASGPPAQRDLRGDLDLLRRMGLSTLAAGFLSGRLAELPLEPQHGDYWPRNVICDPAGWRVIDFECCGEVALPLYDAFHMIRGCAQAIGARATWLRVWHEAGAEARPLARSLATAAGPLDERQVETALCAYMVDFVARLHRRGISDARTAVWLRELEELPSILEAGLLTSSL